MPAFAPARAKTIPLHFIDRSKVKSIGNLVSTDAAKWAKTNDFDGAHKVP